MATAQKEKVTEASKRLDRGEVFGIGSFKISENGATSSLRTTVGSDFVKHHGIEAGDRIHAWIDSSTGAMIILPESDHE